MNISDWSLNEIYDCLDELDSNPEVEVTDWEAKFIASVMKQIKEQDFVSEKQRKIIQGLVTRYGN